MKKQHMIGSVVLIVASAAFLAAEAADGPSRKPALLSEFDALNPASELVVKLLDETPYPGADLTYAGLVNLADRTAKGLRPLRRPVSDTHFAVENRDDDEETHIELNLILEGYLAAVQELVRGLPSAKADVVRWLLTAKAVKALAEVRPDRLDFAPLTGRTGVRIDEARRRIESVLPALVESGYAIREQVLSKLPADDASGLRLAAARAVAKRGAAAQASAVSEFDRRLSSHPTIAAYRKWLMEEALGLHRVRRGRIEQLASEPDAPSFEVGDLGALVPWQVALAEFLGLGTIRINWESAGFEAAGTDGASLAPLIEITARFFPGGPKGESAGVRIYTIKLRGPAVDARTFGDEAGYREALLKYSEGKFPPAVKALIADKVGIPTVAALLAKLADPAAAGGAPIDLKPFHDFRRRTLGDNLAHNPTAHALYQRTWGPRPGTSALGSASIIGLELHYLIRAPKLRLAGPKLPPVAPPAAGSPPPAPPPPNDEAWFRELNLGSRSVEPFDINVGVVVAMIRDAFEQALECVETDAIAAVNDDPSLVELAKAEGRTRGATARAIAEGLRIRRESVNRVLSAHLTTWARPESLFEHPDPVKAGKLPTGGNLPVIAELARVWSDAERDAEFAAAQRPDTPKVWVEFIKTLTQLEALALASLGREAGKEATHFAGRVRPSAWTAFPASPTPDSAIVELDAFEDSLAMVRLAILEVPWIGQVLGEMTPGSGRWPAYVYAHAVPESKPPATPAALPAIPGAFRLSSLQTRRAVLVAGIRSRLERARTELESVNTRVLSDVKRRQAEFAATYPERRYELGSNRLTASQLRELRRLRLLEENVKSALEDINAVAAGKPLTDARVEAYAGAWPAGTESVGPTGSRIRATAEVLKSMPALVEWSNGCRDAVEALIPVPASPATAKTEAKTQPKRSAPAHHDREAMLARSVDGGLASVLEIAWWWEARGVSPDEAWRTAVGEYIAKGTPVDPADLIVQFAHQEAARAGVRLDVKLGRAGIEGRGFLRSPAEGPKEAEK